MTEKDLDVAIEKCERIMEFDTRTMQNPVSENGWIFEKVYELLKYLRQFQFATGTNVGDTSDTISRQAAINAVCEDGTRLERQGQYSMTMVERKQRDVDILEALPSAQQWILCSERLPEEPFGCIVTVWDTNPYTMDEFENVLPYFVGWDGEQWNDGDGELCPFEVIAWMPRPEPYRPEGDEDDN